MQKNTANQRFFVKAFDDNGAVTGDAANITCQLSIDGGAYAATDDVNPTEIGTSGQYVFDLTQAETNGYELSFVPKSSTSGVQVLGVPENVIYTTVPLDLSALAQAVAERMAGVQLSYQQQVQLSSEKRLAIVQGDDYSLNAIRIDIDVDGSLYGEEDLTRYDLVISYERGYTDGLRMPILQESGEYYCLFKADWKITKNIPVGHYPALFRVEYDDFVLFTIGQGWLSVTGHYVRPLDIRAAY
ncbi:hypothetical protein LOC71_22270 [Rhodopirellula sp. JC740]|uniref:Uncharacterized protein n=1 Tax=Rhodopirellula halodulae TaxID=2894198 RepID=A0ABS8NN47_9BACT|nr:hypothetical protein [Rhodopirellula sp. JC740]MCC9645012.1 hypothetical protein [Rhodopirellula sp. JC740]